MSRYEINHARVLVAIGEIENLQEMRTGERTGATEDEIHDFIVDKWNPIYELKAQNTLANMLRDQFDE